MTSRAHRDTRGGRLHAARILSAAWLLVGCVYADGVAYVTYEGGRYSGGPASNFQITAEDVSKIGTSSDVQAPVESDVYALDGVAVEQAIVVISHSEESGYWLMLRDGVRPPPARNDTFDPSYSTIPGLCRYLRTPPPSC